MCIETEFLSFTGGFNRQLSGHDVQAKINESKQVWENNKHIDRCVNVQSEIILSEAIQVLCDFRLQLPQVNNIGNVLMRKGELQLICYGYVLMNKEIELIVIKQLLPGK